MYITREQCLVLLKTEAGQRLTDFHHIYTTIFWMQFYHNLFLQQNKTQTKSWTTYTTKWGKGDNRTAVSTPSCSLPFAGTKKCTTGNSNLVFFLTKKIVSGSVMALGWKKGQQKVAILKKR
jgi:hypothetical protein